MIYPSDKDENYLAKVVEYYDDNSMPSDDALPTEFREVLKVADHAKNFITPSIDKARLFSKIESKIAIVETTQPKVRRMFLVGSSIAAIGIILIGFLFFNHQTKVSTSFGKSITYNLPDDSDVILNSNSVVTFPSNFKKDRKLKLNGEAFFQVEKGSTFKVESAHGTVSVLGTSFNVISREALFSVECKTGKVEVMIGDDAYILNPGEEILKLKDAPAVKRSTTINSIGSWKNGAHTFHQTPLGVVVASLENFYNVKIEVDINKTKEEFSGSFVNDDIDKALKMVFLPMGLQYEKSKNLIVVQ